MSNYWLIPMDFNTCNYEQMEKEWNNNNKIMWQVPGTPIFKKKTGKWEVGTSSMARSLKRGDVVYFYVTNLPSESKENLSRIMLRGIIEDEPLPMEKNKVYWNSKDTTMIIGFSIGSITTLHKENLENNSFLSLEYLRNIDINFRYPQGKRWLDKEKNKNLSEKIILNLEECFKNKLNENDFKVLIEHFKRKCFFCDKYGSIRDHKTFISRNGLDYLEYHHFIPRYKAKTFPGLKGIIDAPANGLFLCSNCHNRIHYGRIEEVNKMIKIVLEDSEIKEMLSHYDFHKSIGENVDVFEWFQDAYNSKEK